MSNVPPHSEPPPWLGSDTGPVGAPVEADEDSIEAIVMARENNPDPSEAGGIWMASLFRKHPGAHLSRHLAAYMARIKKTNVNEYAQILAHIGSVKGRIQDFKAILKEERVRIKKLNVSKAKRDSRSVADCVDDDGAPAEVECPPGYRLDDDGLAALQFSTNEDGDPIITAKSIAPRPIYVRRVITSIENDASHMELRYLGKSGRWRTETVPESWVANPDQMLKKLVDKDVPVAGHNKKDLSQALVTFTEHNADNYPPALCTKTVGIVAHRDSVGFITKDGYTNLIGDPLDIQLAFPDGTPSKLGAAITEDGTVKGWLPVLDVVRPHKFAYLTLIGSFAAPLVRLLGRSTIILDLSNKKGKGKTLACAAACSVWGYFHMGKENTSPKPSMKGTWNASLPAIENMLTSACGIPVALDEGKMARNDKIFRDVIYMVTMGEGGARANSDGSAREVKKLNGTVVFSTNESPIVQFAPDEGAYRRILSIEEPPFPEDMEIVRTIERTIRHNHGVIGRKWIEAIAANIDRLPEWEARADAIQREFEESTRVEGVDGGTANSLAELFATLEITAQILFELGVLPGNYDSPVMDCIPSIMARPAASADKSVEALSLIAGLAATTMAPRIYDPGAARGEFPPPMGYVAAYTNTADEPCLFIERNECRRIIRDAGFTPDAVLRDWFNEGILAGARSHTAPTVMGNIAGGSARGYAIKMSAIDKVVSTTI